MILALSQLAGNKIKQTPKGTKIPPKKKAYTLKQIAAIAQDINDGKIQLPDIPDFESNEEYECLWALVDSGSSVHVVDMPKVFPGAKIRKPHPQSKGFKVADGSNAPDLGSAIVPARTAEGNNISIQWKNAQVAMPILSTKLLSTGGKGLWYHEHGGSIVDPQACTKSDFVESGGVYFIKLMVKRSLTNQPEDARGDNNKKPQGFAGQGAAA